MIIILGRSEDGNKGGYKEMVEEKVEVFEFFFLRFKIMI